MRNFWLILSVFWLWTCSGGGDKATGPEEPPIVVNLTSLTGQAQKGPFNNGTSINVAELSNTLSPTGRNFSSAITDNTGRFAVANVQLESPFVELRATGFYFNEVSNNISDSQLTLYALSDLTNKSSLNVNILTHLEKNRMQVLMSGDNPKTFAQAKLQAQEEVLAIFDYSRANMPASELLDISQGGAANAKLLAISAILQGNQTVGQMSELLANISTDLSADGTLDDSNLQSQLITNTQGLDVAKIRSNLSARFTALGITATIPDFETEINQFLKPPVAQDMSASTGEDTPINITLAASDPEGESLTYTILEVNNATVTLNGNVATYTPNANFNGTDTFTYKANDGTLDSNIATVTMTVSAEDDEPNTLDVATTTDEDVAVTVNLSAEEYDGDSYSFAIVTDVSNGTTSLNGSTVTYTPNQDFNGEDTFTFEATDDTGRTINVATATITVNPVNDAPIVEDIRVTLNENRLITINLDEKESSDIKFTINSNRSGSIDITLTADDPEGDTLVFSIIETNAGAVSLEDDVATYTPSQDWNGVDTFSFKAFDGELESNVAKVILSVNPQNDAPTVKDMTITTSEDTDIEFILDGTDIDGDNLHYSIVTDVVIGDNNIELENSTGPNVIFQPGNNWFGTEQFTYRANDGSLDSNVAQVTLVVTPVNDAPTANDVTATVSETRTSRSYFSLDASDIDGDVLEYIITENVSNGTVSLNGAEVNYVPSQDFVGQDTLKYKVNDGVLDSNIAAAYITISAVNDVPVAEEIYSSVDEDSSVEITLKASDVDSESLNYYVSKSSSNATLEQTASKITYAPNTDFNGYDSFQYYAVDEESQVSNIATVHVNVNPIEDAPKLEDTDTTIYYTLEYGVPDTVSFTNFPDVDPDGDAVTYYFKGDSTKFSFSSTTQDTLYCIDCSGAYAASIYGIDEKGNQGASSAFTVNLIGGPQGLAAVEEYTAGYVENNDLRDTSVSYLPPSLGRTGYIIENRAGVVNDGSLTRDFDRFNYWTEPSQFHIELDFSQESLAWDYLNQTINGYVPFTAYLIDAFDNSKEQLFAGYWENDGESGFSNSGDGTWAGPVYGAAAWEPIYLFLPQDGVVYEDESQYISDNDLETSGGIGWASSNPRELRSSLDFGEPPSVMYPLMTATLFTAYMSGSTLPTADGHDTYGSGYDGASSVVFKTSFDIYDNPDGTNNSRNSMENTFDPSSEEVLLPQMNFNRKFSSDEFMYEQGIEQ